MSHHQLGSSRPGIGAKSAGVAVVAVLIVAAVGALIYSSTAGAPTKSLPSFTFTGVSFSNTTYPGFSGTSTASATSQSLELHITNMYGAVSGKFPVPSQNSSSVAGKTAYDGVTAQPFQVNFDIVYQGCAGSCPSKIVAVSSGTPGFTVTGTLPDLPVPVVGAAPIQLECHFVVTVQPPSTPYTGTLTLVAQAQ